jgi:predicted nucleic acid-binding protein
MSATRTQIYLTDEQHDAVDRVAEAEGVSMAEVIRRALAAYLSDVVPILRQRWRPPSVRHRTRQRRAATSGFVADVLVDTDVFVDHLRSAVELRTKGHRIHYSVITRAELIAGSSATDVVSTLLAPFREVPVGRAIADRAGRIRRESGVRLPGALIAATAVEGGLALATRNRTDFARVRGLRFRRLT